MDPRCRECDRGVVWARGEVDGPVVERMGRGVVDGPVVYGLARGVLIGP